MDALALKTLFSALDARRTGADTAVNLPGADLRGAHLMCADLQRANLGHVRLDKSNLAGAKLAHAKLTGASLGSADLTGADLRGADLSGAALDGALLTAADLRGAKLSQTSGDPASVAGARLDFALCERSGFDEAEIIKFVVAGARIDDLSEFSQAVRDACATVSVPSGPPSGPRSRRSLDGDASSRRFRTSLPSSARSAQLVSTPDGGDEPPRSVRFFRGWVDDMDDSPFGESRKPVPLRRVRKSGDQVLGVTLLSQIGSGSSSTVWRGTESDGTAVAVKLFEPPAGDWVAAHAAFLRGMRAMTRLAAPGKPLPATIARIRRSGAGGLDLVTDYAARGNVGALPPLKWSLPRIISFYEALCQAIAFAHEAGIMHRCLKPSNILLSDQLEPIVTDFDMVDLPSLARGSNPRAGAYAAYAAPEALAGEAMERPAADVYSLGRILYFMLMGCDPPEIADSGPDGLLLRDKPADLTEIVRRATLHDPAQRYQRVRDLLADLKPDASGGEHSRDIRLSADPAPSARDGTPPTARSTEPTAASASPPAASRSGPAELPFSASSGRPVASVRSAVSAPPADAEPVVSSRPKGAIAATPAASRSSARPVPAQLPRSSQPATGRSGGGSVALPSAPPVSDRSRRSDRLPAAAHAPSVWLARRTETTIAMLGTLLLAVITVTVATVALPSPGLVWAVRCTGAVAAAMSSFVLPHDERHPRLSRTILALAAAMLVYFLDPTRLAG